MSFGSIQAEKMTTESGYSLGAGNASSFKNRVINPGMVIDQRNGGASVSNIGDGQVTLDRWASQTSVGNKFSIQQNAGSVTPPAGFTNYIGATSTSAYSVIANDFSTIQQNIEGFNVSDLGWGTANAKDVTVSFWVQSSLTGSFGGTVANSAQSRTYPFAYTINSANTWEYKTVTIPGDTTGTWLTNSGLGIRLRFSLGCGSSRVATAGVWTTSLVLSATGTTSILATNGATLYITGVQLEVGTVATSFDYRPYGTEFMLCQRYFQQLPSVRNGSGPQVIVNYMFGSTDRIPLPALPVIMRAAPTIVSYRTNGTTSGETTEFSSSTNRVVTSIPNPDACGGGYLQCSTSFSNPTQLNLTYSAEL